VNVIDKYWQAAQVSGGISGIDPKLLYCQWFHETAGFASELCLQYNNLAGVTQTQENDLPQPDGRFYYMKFDSLDSWARYFGKFICLFDGTVDANSITEYATALKNEGYFGDPLEVYINGMESAYNNAFA